MASWLKCTAKRDGAAVYVNLGQCGECVLERARQRHHHSIRWRREGCRHSPREARTDNQGPMNASVVSGLIKLSFPKIPSAGFAR